MDPYIPDYQLPTYPFDLESTIGSFLMSGSGEVADFIAKDSRSPSAPEIFSYKEDSGSLKIMFPALRLIVKGEIGALKKLAQEKPEAVKALLLWKRCESGNRRTDVYSLAQEDNPAWTQGKNPKALAELIELAGALFGDRAFSLVNDGIFGNPQTVVNLTAMDMNRIVPMLQAIQALPKTEAENSLWERLLKKTVQSRLASGYLPHTGGIFPRTTNVADDFASLFEGARTMLRKQDGDAAIAEALKKNIIRNLATNMHNPEQPEFLKIAFTEAARVGLTKSDITGILTRKNEKGRTLMHEAVESWPGIFPFLVEKLKESMGENESRQWLDDFLKQKTMPAFIYSDSKPESVFTRAPSGGIEDLLRAKAYAAGLDGESLAEFLYSEFSAVANPQTGATAMHKRRWAESNVLGLPSGESMVVEGLSRFVKGLDNVFGTEVAVPLAARLFALTDAKGETPLQKALYKNSIGDYGRAFYPVMVKELKKALGDNEKFARYMKEAIIPTVPQRLAGMIKPLPSPSGPQ